MNVQAIVSNLLLFAAASVVTLLIGELAIRQISPEDLSLWSLTRDGLITHRPHARMWSSLYGRELRTNSLGMRDVEHPSPKPEGEFRVLLLGDSFTEAFMVDDDAILARQLERTLTPRVPGQASVVNAGVSGWGTDHALHYAMRNAEALDLDLIVYTLTLYTDVGDNLAMQFHALEGGALVERPPARTEGREAAFLALKENLAATSQLFQFVRRTMRAEAEAAQAEVLSDQFADLFRTREPERLVLGRTLTGQLLHKAAQVGDRLGVPTVVVLIPMATQLSDREYAAYLEAEGLDRVEARLDWPQEALRRRIESATAGELPVIDLLEPFRRAAGGDSETLFSPVDLHWNPAGHALAAEVLAVELARLGVLD